MLNKTTISFPLKGQRKYVHGTDIFNYFFQNINEFNTLTLSFHEPCLDPNCKIIELSSDDEVPDDKAAVFKINIDNVFKCFYIETSEAVDISNAKRIAYDEEKITLNAILSEKEARLEPDSSYSFIENLVALNKHFHQSYFNESGGQWFFAQLELNHSFDNQGELVLVLHKNMGSRFTQTKIFQYGKEIGTIYFSYHK